MLRRQRRLKDDDIKGKNRWRDKIGRQRSAFSHTVAICSRASMAGTLEERKINDREAVIGWEGNAHLRSGHGIY